MTPEKKQRQGVETPALSMTLEGHHMPTACQNVKERDSPNAPSAQTVLTAGVTLQAVDALATQDTFTREQVAYLMHLAYESGRTATHLIGCAEVRCADLSADTVRALHAEQVAARGRV